MIYTCRTLCKFKSDTDWLYIVGDRVTHIETGTGQFAVLDRDETCAFTVLVVVASAGLLLLCVKSTKQLLSTSSQEGALGSLSRMMHLFEHLTN